MEMIDLNIPSKFAHSIFVDVDGKEVNVKKGHIDIFYTLVYLGRRKLLELNNNCLLNDVAELKGGKKKKVKRLKDGIDYSETLSFEFYEIASLIFEAKQQSKDTKEGKHNSRYNKIRKFINEFKDVYVKTNLFNKDKTEGSKIIKVFDKLEVSSIDKLCFDVIFTEEYISPYMVTKEYFKKVRLDILYKLNSIYSKKIYIILKDYEGCDKKTNKNDISMFLGMDYSKTKTESYLSEINKNSDIIVELEKPKHGKKSDIKFTIENQDYFANEDEKEHHNFIKWVDELMMEDSKELANIKISNGDVIEDYDSYVYGAYKNKKRNPYEFENYQDKYHLNKTILNCKEMLIEGLDSQRGFPTLYFESQTDNGIPRWLVIDNNYKLFDITSNQEITSDARKTLAYLQNLGNSDNLFKKVKYDSIKNENFSMMYF
jgi:plasmid replication initiation protein